MSAAVGAESVTAKAGYTTVPVGRLRRVTARRMQASVAEKPHVTLHRRARVDALMTARQLEQARMPVRDQAQLTVTALLVAAVARALAHEGRLNGRVEDGEIRLYHQVNVGVAVEVDGGLMVPVVRDAAARDLPGLAAELHRLVQTARSGTMRPEDISDATFTVSNLGSYGVELFTPIINPPQLAILGVGSVLDHPVLDGGRLVTHRRVGLSLSFDHAANDGAEAARTLANLVHEIENPYEGGLQ